MPFKPPLILSYSSRFSTSSPILVSIFEVSCGEGTGLIYSFSQLYEIFIFYSVKWTKITNYELVSRGRDAENSD
jgi:hypothetical protein